MPETVQIEKLVHGGQGLGILKDGRKVFVWNALPGETVSVELWRKKKSYAEGLAVEVIKPAPERLEPKEKNYLSTSPWQIMDFATENHWKQEITRDLFRQAGVELPDFSLQTDGIEYHYRNKMEYSFWGDDDGVHLALYNRGSHQKQIVTGSALALPAIDKAANALLAELNNRGVHAGDLKTIIVRCNQVGKTVGALFVKPKAFPKLALPRELSGLRVYHSNPKSPASVRTELLYELGDVSLADELHSKSFTYDVDSFFQVNLPIFNIALESMKQYVEDADVVDMYAGVGSIGLSLAQNAVDLVESDSATASMATVNAKESGLKASVTQVPSEKTLDYITADKLIIFDPPRAGLHSNITSRILEAKPPKIIYLSCNPATQSRDIALLSADYQITHFEVFNFFPRTPHIETLAVLTKI